MKKANFKLPKGSRIIIDWDIRLEPDLYETGNTHSSQFSPVITEEHKYDNPPPSILSTSSVKLSFEENESYKFAFGLYANGQISGSTENDYIFTCSSYTNDDLVEAYNKSRADGKALEIINAPLSFKAVNKIKNIDLDSTYYYNGSFVERKPNDPYHSSTAIEGEYERLDYNILEYINLDLDKSFLSSCNTQLNLNLTGISKNHNENDSLFYTSESDIRDTFLKSFSFNIQSMNSLIYTIYSNVISKITQIVQ